MSRQGILTLLFALFMLPGCNLVRATKSGNDDASTTSTTTTSRPTPVDFSITKVVLTAGELCPELEILPVTDLTIIQTPNMAEPLARSPFQDPAFGSCLVRVTDRETDLDPNDPSLGIKNEYSRVQAFNSDGRYFLLRGVEATWYVYDAGTLEPILLLPFDGAVDPRWSAEDPYRIFYNEETTLMAYDIQEARQTIIHDFSGDLPGRNISSVSTRYEGSPSSDGRYWGFMALDRDWQARALLVYDQELDQVIARRDLGDGPEIDSVTISPSGKYFLAYFDYCESRLGADNRPCGLMVYDRNLDQGRGLLRIIGHSDLALDANDREVLIYQDIDTDHIAMLDLESGEITPLWPINFSHSAIGFHFSGRALDRKGWALVSTYNGAYPKDATWMDDQVFAVELKPQGHVVRLAHTHSLVDEEQEHDYWAEPQATVNPDFTRILFTTNWGRSGSGEVDTIMILMPEFWPELLE